MHRGTVRARVVKERESPTEAKLMYNRDNSAFEYNICKDCGKCGETPHNCLT